MLFVLLLLLVPFINARSQDFHLIVEAPGTILENCILYISYEDNRLYMANETTMPEAEGVILENGKVLLEEEMSLGIGIGKNYLFPSHNVSLFASPFTIQGGYLKLYSNDFHAVPSGIDGIYVIGSINAAAGRSDVIPIKIKPIIGEFGVKINKSNQVIVASDYDAPNYSGTMKSISPRTKPYNMHHGEKTTQVATSGSVLFMFLNYIF